MNRPRSESVREGKLRAACDRCHDLKNRCVRIGGPDSRCDRCERLDIDCVYQESSRMGRPKRQRKTSSFQPPQPDQESHQRMPSTTSDRMPEMSVAVATGPELNVVQMEADTSQSGSTTLIDSPSEAMRFLMSPKGIQTADPYWGMDFSHHIGNLHDPLFHVPQESPQVVQILNSQDPNGSRVGASNHKEPASTLTDRLFQLQGKLYRVLLADVEQPEFDSVQEGLKAAKSFLDTLQNTDSSHSGQESDPVLPVESLPDKSTISHITVQQALTCYSYVLLLLDRVVGDLTTRAGIRSVSDGQEFRTALHLGVFNLASQPALNDEIVLHLVLCMVQKMRSMIHMLASSCDDLVNVLDPSLIGNRTDFQSLGQSNTTPLSTGTIMYAVSDHVLERETSLVERVERLSTLTTGIRHR